MDWLGFTIVILCLLVSGFFAASETALTGASRASMLRPPSRVIATPTWFRSCSTCASA